MKLERISKPYWNSSKQDALAVVVPKIVRETLGISPDTYVKWELEFKDEGVHVTFVKV